MMRLALIKVAFMPFGLLVETWLWRVLNGTISENDLNKGWWRLKHDLQGIQPPVPRSEEDFDPAAKYHIAEGSHYIHYYIAHYLQFQFFEALCKISGHTGPLHRCDFYKSKDAGKLLR